MPDRDPNREPRLTLPEVAARLGVSELTVRRYIKAGELVAIRLGQKAGYRFRPEDVDAFERRRMTSHQIARDLLDSTLNQ